MFMLIIQAGGESKRMGRDKGLATFQGVPLVQRVLDRFRGLAEAVVVITNHPRDYCFLEVPLVGDILPGRGALGGLYTALRVANDSGAQVAGVIACDLPFASPKLLDAARRLMQETGADAVIPRTSHGTEPFHAIYRPGACLPAVKNVLEAGKWRADAWFLQVQIRFMTPEEYRLYDPHGLAFLNVNTPQELREAEDKARDLSSQIDNQGDSAWGK